MKIGYKYFKLKNWQIKSRASFYFKLFTFNIPNYKSIGIVFFGHRVEIYLVREEVITYIF